MNEAYQCPTCGEEGLSEEEIETIRENGQSICQFCSEVYCSSCGPLGDDEQCQNCTTGDTIIED